MAGVSEPPGLLSEGHQDRQEGFEVRIILEDRRERGERRGWRGVRQELEECRRGVLVWDIDGGVGIGWEMKNEGTVVVADCSCSFCWWNMNFMSIGLLILLRQALHYRNDNGLNLIALQVSVAVVILSLVLGTSFTRMVLSINTVQILYSINYSLPVSP